jgi:membrane protein DedA with SNARE-associated domain
MQIGKRLVLLWLWLAPGLAFAASSAALQRKDDIRISWAVVVLLVSVVFWAVAIRKRNRMTS